MLLPKIFGIGLSRTGTTSLGRALTALGIPTIHYPYDAVTQEELEAGNFHLTILKRYRAVLDISVVPFYAQLDEAYPGSKFILTTRSLKEWLESLEKHWESLEPMGGTDPQFKRFTEFICAEVYGTTIYEEVRMRNAYVGHVSRVRSYFANRSSDLLEMDITNGEGWEALCPFLEMEIPNTGFPYSNQKGKALGWITGRESVKVEVEEVVPPGSTILLVDDGSLDQMKIDGCSIIRLTELKGHPGTGEEAAGRISQYAAEADYLVLAWTSFWWLEIFPQFQLRLEERYCRLYRSSTCLIYSLASRISR